MRTVICILAVCCCLTAASGQWLEKTIALSDSFGSVWPQTVHYVPASNCVYVADRNGVIVLDAATNTRVARIDLREPTFFAYDSRDNKAYLSVDDTVVVIDPFTHRVALRLDAGRKPSALSYNPDVNKLYCRTGPDGDSITVVDCDGDSVLARVRVGWTEYEFLSMSCVPAGNKVYATSFEDYAVAVIDGIGDSLIRTLYTGDYPGALVYSQASNKLYCADVEDEEVAVFDAGPDTLLRFIDMGAEPFALGYSPLSNKVYSANLDSGVAVIDCASDTITATFGIDVSAPTSFLFDSVDNRIFCFDRYFDSIPAISCGGDTMVRSIQIGGDAYAPDVACYSPEQNRIYMAGRGPDDVFVVDAGSCSLSTAVQMHSSPLLGAYAANEDKLYCTDEEDGIIAVINCSTDSLERRIVTSPVWELRFPVYSSGSNKLYYDAWLPLGRGLLVLDCARDSFSASLPMNTDGPAGIVYNPNMDRLYWAGNMSESTVVVIDCAGDSVVAEVPVGHNLCGLTGNTDSNLVYCASRRGDSMFVSAIDCSADSVIGTVFVHDGFDYGPFPMCYVPSRDAVVCKVPGANLVVVDGKARQLLQIVSLGGSVSQLRLDRAANKLFCLFEDDEDLAVVDCRDMSLAARIRVAARPDDIALDSVASRLWVTSPWFGCISLVDGRANRFLDLFEAGESPGDITWVPQHRKMYVIDQKGQAVLVLRDTTLAGVHENSMSSLARAMPTIVHGMLALPRDGLGTRSGLSDDPVMSRAALLDVSGRKILDLHPGANDVRALAPGVYFIRRPETEDGRPAQAVRKVVVTR